MQARTSIRRPARTSWRWPQAGAQTLARAGITPKPAAERNPNDPSSWGKVGRNEDCPCGSGKKYKHCHGRLRLDAMSTHGALRESNQSPGELPGDFVRNVAMIV